MLNQKSAIGSTCLLFILAAISWAQPMPKSERKKTPDPELVGKTNPHWTGKYCTECHEEKPRPGKPVTFKFGGDFIKQCNSCHDTALSRMTEHVVGVGIKESEMLKKPSADFPLQDGKITCITCHDARIQEQTKISAKRQNPLFLRGVTGKSQLTFEWSKSEVVDERYSQNRYVICFECHRKEKLLQWSPHKNQINRNGEVNDELCLYCHSEVPDRNAIDKIEWKLKGEIQKQCLNCHMGKTRYHPIRVTHYGNTLPVKITNQIKLSERRIGIMIPLGIDVQGEERLVCTSCHNPHQRGVLKNRITRKGADSDKRLRLDGFTMCLSCHGVDIGTPTPGF